jgi:NAD(P)-dependent dehydrogenase (short-subunit alcohol dehydrogenase family)
MDLQPNGKLALVSGCAAGLGFALAEAPAVEGAHVIVNGGTRSGVAPALPALRESTNKDALGFVGTVKSAL